MKKTTNSYLIFFTNSTKDNNNINEEILNAYRYRVMYNLN